MPMPSILAQGAALRGVVVLVTVLAFCNPRFAYATVMLVLAGLWVPRATSCRASTSQRSASFFVLNGAGYGCCYLRGNGLPFDSRMSVPGFGGEVFNSHDVTSGSSHGDS
jgi:hypothetical protein